MSDWAILPRMADSSMASALGTGGSHADDDPSKIRDAAQQFEALLLAQMLRSVREGTGNWLSTGEDSSGDSATDFAEQQFAAVMAQQGGIGLASLIARGLRKD